MCSICMKSGTAYYAGSDWQRLLSWCHRIAPELFLHTWCWCRLISYNRITSVWSEGMVCAVCSYIDQWLADLFLNTTLPWKDFCIRYKCSMVISRFPWCISEKILQEWWSHLSLSSSRLILLLSCRLCFLMSSPATALTVPAPHLNVFFILLFA